MRNSSPFSFLSLALLATFFPPRTLPAQIPDSSVITEHVRGIVLNSVDHQPVTHALVVSGDQRMATFTDSEGRFSVDVRRSASTGSAITSTLPVLPGGRSMDPNQLRALRSTAGYLNLRKPGYLSANVALHISPDPATTSEDQQFKLIPAGVIRGHVSTPTGNPPPGISVQLRSRQVQFGVEVWAPAGSVRVNGHGDYHFGDLAAGDYKVMTSAWTEDQAYGSPPLPDQSAGYKAAFYTEALNAASAPALHLHSGDTIQADLNLRSATLYHVSIPLPQAETGGVSVMVGTGDQDSSYSLFYNFQSQSLEGFLPNGAYDIRVFAYGQQPSSGVARVEVNGRPVKGAPITLVPDGEIPVIVHQEFTAVTPEDQPNGRIARALSARPVEVFLRPDGGDGPGANLKNPQNAGNDKLVLAGVAEGRYRVVANPYRGYVSSITCNGVDLLRQPLTVGPGGASEPIEIILRDDSASLTGTISLPSGSDVDAQLIVTFIPLNSGNAANLPQTGAFEGRFMMQNLPPGEYLVVAAPGPSPNLDLLDPAVLSRLKAHGTTVTLAPGDKQEIQVPLLSDLGDQAAGEN